MNTSFLLCLKFSVSRQIRTRQIHTENRVFIANNASAMTMLDVKFVVILDQFAICNVQKPHACLSGPSLAAITDMFPHAQHNATAINDDDQQRAHTHHSMFGNACTIYKFAHLCYAAEHHQWHYTFTIHHSNDHNNFCGCLQMIVCC